MLVHVDTRRMLADGHETVYRSGHTFVLRKTMPEHLLEPAFCNAYVASQL